MGYTFHGFFFRARKSTVYTRVTTPCLLSLNRVSECLDGQTLRIILMSGIFFNFGPATPMRIRKYPTTDFPKRLGSDVIIIPTLCGEFDFAVGRARVVIHSYYYCDTP